MLTIIHSFSLEIYNNIKHLLESLQVYHTSSVFYEAQMWTPTQRKTVTSSSAEENGNENIANYTSK